MTLLAELDTLETKLLQFPAALRAELHRLVLQAADFLLDFNKEYLEAGQTVDGNALGPYSPAYAAYKQKYGRYKQTGHIDLKFSGEFYDSFQIEAVGELIFHIIATDEKYAFLRKYGEILGVRTQDLAEFLRILIEPDLRVFASRYLKS